MIPFIWEVKQRGIAREAYSIHSRWVRYPEAGFGLIGVVAASVSEWMSFHSLTLAATPEMKKMRRIGIEAVPIKGPGNLYCRPDRWPGEVDRPVVSMSAMP